MLTSVCREALHAGDGAWWFGRVEGDLQKCGTFPSNFVEIVGAFPDRDILPPTILSPGDTRSTPSPLRSAMNDVMPSLDDLALDTKPLHPPVNRWSPEAFELLFVEGKNDSQTPDSRMELGNDHHGSKDLASYISGSKPQHITDQSPSPLDNYVRRMEDRLRRMQEGHILPSNSVEVVEPSLGRKPFTRTSSNGLFNIYTYESGVPSEDLLIRRPSSCPPLEFGPPSPPPPPPHSVIYALPSPSREQKNASEANAYLSRALERRFVSEYHKDGIYTRTRAVICSSLTATSSPPQSTMDDVLSSLAGMSIAPSIFTQRTRSIDNLQQAYSLLKLSPPSWENPEPNPKKSGFFSRMVERASAVRTLGQKGVDG